MVFHTDTMHVKDCCSDMSLHKATRSPLLTNPHTTLLWWKSSIFCVPISTAGEHRIANEVNQHDGCRKNSIVLQKHELYGNISPKKGREKEGRGHKKKKDHS